MLMMLLQQGEADILVNFPIGYELFRFPVLGGLFTYNKEKNPISISKKKKIPLCGPSAENKPSWLPLAICWTSSACDSFHDCRKEYLSNLPHERLKEGSQCCCMAGGRKNGKAIPTLVKMWLFYFPSIQCPLESMGKGSLKNHICFKE